MYIRQFFSLFLFRFSAATKYEAEFTWPKDSVITYVYKEVDTHNALNMGTGAFTAPFSGVYGFTFTARFNCGYDGRGLSVFHNEKYAFTIHQCRLLLTDSTSDYIYVSDTVHFTRIMQKGDRLQIYSGTAELNTSIVNARFNGFLLKKN